jgi:signal transduction histidine kinase
MPTPGRIAVRVVFGPFEVDLDVKDDGGGFSPAANGAGKAMHFGLSGMRERVEESGGPFRLESGLGRGTRVTAKTPLAQTIGCAICSSLGPSERRARAG